MGCCNCNQYSLPDLPTQGSVAGSYLVTNDWNVPVCGNTATVIIPNINNVVIGAWLFHPTYGYFKITAFNYLTAEATILNTCDTGSFVASAGTLVPANSLFLLTPGSDLSIYKTWNIAISGLNGMTWTVDNTNGGINFAKYIKQGPMVSFTFRQSGVPGGTLGTTIMLAGLPTAKNVSESSVALTVTGGQYFPSYLQTSVNTTTIFCPNGFSGGLSTITGKGSFEVA